MTRALAFGLALLGVVLALDGWRGGGTGLHRLAAIGVGVSLIVPGLVRIAFGTRADRWVARVLLAALGATAGLTAGELLTRVAGARPFDTVVLVPDERLGHRLAPLRGGQDARGYRNPQALESAAICVLGDSQTFGTNLSLAETYPVRLAAKLGVPVANFGIGGYGPVQWKELCAEALALEPRAIVIGAYLGNDLIDAHRFCGLEAHRELRDPALSYPANPGAARPPGRAPNLVLLGLDFLFERSILIGGLAEGVKRRLRQSRLVARLTWNEPDAPSFEEPAIATQFTPNYRLGSVDLDRPAVRDGLRITALCLAEIADACRQAEVDLVLLVLPTKELTYARLARSRGASPPSGLEVLESAETRATNELLKLARELDLAVLDAGPTLVTALSEGRAAWLANADGHFSPQGAEILAGLLANALE